MAAAEDVGSASLSVLSSQSLLSLGFCWLAGAPRAVPRRDQVYPSSVMDPTFSQQSVALGDVLPRGDTGGGVSHSE